MKRFLLAVMVSIGLSCGAQTNTDSYSTNSHWHPELDSRNIDYYSTGAYILKIPHSAVRFRPLIDVAIKAHPEGVDVVFEPGIYHLVRLADLRGVGKVDGTGTEFIAMKALVQKGGYAMLFNPCASWSYVNSHGVTITNDAH
jgi:hypothetical protein